MKHIILGTAGHIDHGKTSLIKALTGIDCDRLKEEKERGITIELGFTYLDLSSGIRIGIIDVPGHEKFVHHMVSGVVGMDMVLLVIAADEGVMPQTREHLDICHLLGVKRGLIAVTKTDLVDADWLDLVIEEIKEFTGGTFLYGCPVIPVSSTTGVGLDVLVKAIQGLVDALPEEAKSGIFRLPIDRVFTIKGFGTIVTGTLLSGEARVGDVVEILPKGIQARIRGIQTHNERVESIKAGHRTAINLQGVSKEEINRGDVISRSGLLWPSHLLDARLRLLKDVPPLKNRTRIRFHTGTTELFGRVILLDSEELAKGASSLVQFRLEEAVAVMPGDKFIIRRYSPAITLGGGEIIDNHPQKHKRYNDEVLKDLSNIENASPSQLLEYYIRRSGIPGIDLKGLIALTNLEPQVVIQHLKLLDEGKRVYFIDEAHERIVHHTTYENIKTDIEKALREFHQHNPLKLGMSKEALRARVAPDIGLRFYNKALAELDAEDTLTIRNDTCALSGHKVLLSKAEKEIYDKVLSIFKQAGLQPPRPDEFPVALKVDHRLIKKIIDLLLEEGRLIRAKGDILFLKEDLESVVDLIHEFLKEKQGMEIGDFKELTGLSRKFAVPLLEYLDGKGITIRVGDKRVLKKQSS